MFGGITARDLHWGHVILIGIVFFLIFGVICFLIDYKAPINLENKRDNSKILELLGNELGDSLVIQKISISDEFPYPAEIINPIYNNPKYSKLFEFGSRSFYHRTFLIEYKVLNSSHGEIEKRYGCIEKRFMFLKERPKRVLSTIIKD